ncbi:MAG: ABC transporter permease [Cytophagales bacterium]|nr:ABC transporter permease [Cytophagales bacterium]
MPIPNNKQLPTPPRWANQFLQWYCRQDLLEEIQGDAYELYYRTVKKNKWRADLEFTWNVIRFFRIKNIRKSKKGEHPQLYAAMLKNILLVSFRNFWRQPGHSLLNVAGLSVSFACAFLILLWVVYEFSFDKFHEDTDQLFSVITHVEADGAAQSYPVASASIDISSIPEGEKVVTVSTGSRWPHVLCFKPEVENSECIYLSGVYSNENLFSVFKFEIAEGDPNPLGKPDQIVISEKMANLIFKNQNVVGKTFQVDNRAEMTIVAVMKDIPTNSSLQFDFAMPFAFLQKEWGIDENRMKNNFFNTYIKTNVKIDAATLTDKLNTESVVTKELKEQKVNYQALPLKDWRLKSHFEGGQQLSGRLEYVVLFIVIGTLLVVIAVINFINMTTARATTRAKEIGVRKVTGAYRSGIIFQFVGESFLIVLISVVLAILMAQLSLPSFRSLLGEEINLDLISGALPLYVFGFLLLVSLLAGLYPAFVLSSFQPVKVLKNQFPAAVTGSHRLRKALLMIQLSASIGIIIFSAVLYQQLNFIIEKNLGFDRSNMIRLEPTANLFRKFDVFKNELSKNPDILGAASSNMNPLQADGGNTGVEWPGKSKEQRVVFKTIACSYEFPETFGLKILDGRNFLAHTLDSVQTEVVLSEEAVKVMNLTHPIGQTIYIGGSPCVIIGVTNDFHTESLHSSRQPVILYRADYMNTSGVYIKYLPGTTSSSLATVVNAYKTIEPHYSMKYWFQDDTFDQLYKTEITAARLVLVFTIITFIISVMGIAGLATYNVLRRTKEIGIRRVFGASIVQVLKLLTNEFSFVLLFAIFVAAPATWYATDKWLAGFAYRIAMPWWIYATTFTCIGLTVIVIICMQGFKTVTTNPTKTLRNE